MRRAAVMMAAVVALAGCGTNAESSSDRTASSESASQSPSESPGESPSESPSPPAEEKPSDQPAVVPAGTPSCASVWVDGTRLARDYAGCRIGKRFVEPDQEPCSFGQRLVRYGDHFYAVRGGPVNRTAAALAKDRHYRGAIASCRA